MRELDPEGRRLPYGPFSLAFFGLAFARAWLSQVFVGLDGPDAVPILPHGAFDLAYVTCALVVFILSRRIAPLSCKPSAFIAALVGMLMASLMFSFGSLLPTAAWAVLSTACALSGGAAFLLLSMLNWEMLSGVGLPRAVIYVSGSSLLGSLLAFFLSDATMIQAVAAVFALPVISVALVHSACESLPVEDRPRPGNVRCDMPWRLFVVVGSFMFVYGMHQHGFVAGAGRHSSLSTAIVAGTMLLVAYFAPQKLDVSRLWRAPLPLMLCGVMLIPTEGIFGQVASSYLISMGFTLLRFIMTLILLDLAGAAGASILPLASLYASLQLFSMLGGASVRFMDACAGPALCSAIETVVALVLLGTAFLLIYSERELSSRWGVRVLDGGNLCEEPDHAGGIAAACSSLAAAHHLTAREEEVLRELAKGKDTQTIAQNLYIAPGTLRAHTRHIYEKLGIHSRKELEGLLGPSDPN